ncbi:MAG: LapA family protein, partial [Limnothrix sp.]
MNSRSPFILVLLLLFAGATILLLQNSQPLSLVVLSQPLPVQFPLSLWIIGAVLIGLFLSVLIQLLMQTGSTPKGGDRLNERLESLKERPPRKPDNRTGRSDWERSRANYDWTDKEVEEQDGETWDIESPPPRTTRPKPPPKAGDEKVRPQPQPQRSRPIPE